MTDEELRKKLAETLYQVCASERDSFIEEYKLPQRKSRTWDELPKSSKASWGDKVLLFLTLIKQNYVRLDKDQSLPELPKQYRKSKYVSDVYGDGWRNGYTWLKNKIKDGFRKVEDL